MFIGIVVLAVVVPLARAEVKLRRRAALEIPAGLAGSALRRAQREKVADLRYVSRPSLRPASNTSDAGSPGGAIDGGGHDGGGHGGGGHGAADTADCAGSPSR